MRNSISKTIDHTILKANATKEEVKKLCNEAKEHSFASVCVNPKHVPFAYEILKDSDVKVCTVVGFPLGANQTKTKVFETELAISEGAAEIDMVIDIGAVKDQDWEKVSSDIKAVRNAVKSPNLLKVIIETCLLTDAEKEKVCTICKDAGVDFVKTSTGFSTGGATVEDVILMHKVVGPDVKVKASGGVRTYEDAVKMIEAGASRLGTSNGINIVNN